MQYVLLGVGGAAGAAWGWKYLSMVPWPITAAMALILLSITMTFVAYAAKWLTVGQVGRMGMTRPVSWLAKAPLVDPAAAVAPPPALRQPEKLDASAVATRMKAAIDCQDGIVERLAREVCHRLALPPAGPTKPAFSAIIVGASGKSLVADQLAAAIGWPVEVISGRTYTAIGGSSLRDKAEVGDAGTVLDRLAASKQVVVFDHAADLDQAAQRALADLVAGQLSIGGKRISANQLVILVLATALDKIDPALTKAVDGIYELAALDDAGAARVGVRVIVEAGERNKVGFRPSPDAVAAVGSMAPRDAARLLDGLAAEATAAGVAGEAVVDVGVDGRVVLVKPF